MPETTNTVRPKVKPKSVVKKEEDSLALNADTTAKILDSTAIAKADSLRKDSLSKVAIQNKPVLPRSDTSTYAAIMFHKYMPINKEKLFMVTKYRNPIGKEILFYSILGIVGIVAFIRISFPKYVQSLFQLFFQTSFRQKQTREQLLQDNLASLLMNFLFIASAGMFVALIAQKFNWVVMDFWMLFLYCSSLLGLIYLIKYLFLIFSGWVFNVKNSTDTYLFIVFLANKIWGMICIPFVLIIAFSTDKVVNIAIPIVTIILILLLIYRYVASLGTIRSTLKVNALHFFLYLCAVEVMPLLLMYKAFFNFIKE
jgi:hypothetical protein